MLRVFRYFSLCLAALYCIGCGSGTDERGSTLSEDLRADQLGAGQPKVTICHMPPGNPENAHTIVVGAPAAVAHVSQHGDVLGPCDAVDAGVPDAGAPEPDAGTPDAGEPADGGIN